MKLSALGEVIMLGAIKDKIFIAKTFLTSFKLKRGTESSNEWTKILAECEVSITVKLGFKKNCVFKYFFLQFMENQRHAFNIS